MVPLLERYHFNAGNLLQLCPTMYVQRVIKVRLNPYLERPVFIQGNATLRIKHCLTNRLISKLYLIEVNENDFQRQPTDQLSKTKNKRRFVNRSLSLVILNLFFTE